MTFLPRRHVDEDECTVGDDFCDQTCTNTVGSYTCGCNHGYVLNSNGYSCDGMLLTYFEGFDSRRFIQKLVVLAAIIVSSFVGAKSTN